MLSCHKGIMHKSCTISRSSKGSSREYHIQRKALLRGNKTLMLTISWTKLLMRNCIVKFQKRSLKVIFERELQSQCVKALWRPNKAHLPDIWRPEMSSHHQVATRSSTRSKCLRKAPISKIHLSGRQEQTPRVSTSCKPNSQRLQSTPRGVRLPASYQDSEPFRRLDTRRSKRNSTVTCRQPLSPMMVLTRTRFSPMPKLNAWHYFRVAEVAALACRSINSKLPRWVNHQPCLNQDLFVMKVRP
mgnify:FL=1